MFTLDPKLIQNKVFKMLTIDEINEGMNENQNETEKSDESYRSFQYVQIRRQSDTRDGVDYQ